MPRPLVLFAGGGSGGHVFPNLAVIDCLRDRGVSAHAHLLISDRALDSSIAAHAGIPFTRLPVRPLPNRLSAWPRFWIAWRRSIRLVKSLLETDVAAVMATGGFVSGPPLAVVGRRVPTALVNLDARPGRANRRLSQRATKLFTVYDVPEWQVAQPIGFPLRRGAQCEADQATARRQLGLGDDSSTLLVTGGSQGAQSINHMLLRWVREPDVQRLLETWQVLHLGAGPNRNDLTAAYASAGISATVIDFCDRMDLAWGAATIAITRGGAGSVAEAWCNAVPCIFLPYPHHRDQHQRGNAQPFVDSGGGVIMDDQIDPSLNAPRLTSILRPVISDVVLRERMRARLAISNPGNGADDLAEWILGQCPEISVAAGA